MCVLCMYIYMFVCLYMYMCICIYVNISYIYVNRNACVIIYVYIHMRAGAPYILIYSRAAILDARVATSLMIVGACAPQANPNTPRLHPRLGKRSCCKHYLSG